MDLLEHPLEAVAFRLYSLPEASAATGAAAWTCLAAVLAAAAAAGLWRLRSSTQPAMTTTSKTLEVEPSPAERSPEQARSSESTSWAAPSPKERYAAYYYDSSCVGCCDVDDDGDGEELDRYLEDDDGVYEPSETDPFEWEVVRFLPLGSTAAAEMGRYRNSTALNGSVVRLWDQGADGGLTAAASPRRRGRVGIISAF